MTDRDNPNLQYKRQIVAEIARLLEVPTPSMSTGSSEPRAIFEAIDDVLGLGLDARLDKPRLAQEIVEASGGRWLPTYDSRGSTVTRDGLLAVLDAVRYFVR